MTNSLGWILPISIISGIFLLLLIVLFYLRVKLPNSIKPKHVLIIGGSSGLGLELAKIVSKKNPNAKITLLARNLSKLEKAKESLTYPDKCEVLSFDICGDKTDDYRHENIVNKLKQKISPSPDIVICSAGQSVNGLFEDTPISAFQQQMDMHYFSCVLPAKAFLPEMKKQKRGRICFISSVAGQLGVWGLGAYSGSKFALTGLAQALAYENRPFNVGITVSYPPDMDTPGLAAENIDKPWECHKISETGGLVQPGPVAETLWNDILSGKFASTHGMDAWFSATMTAGWNPCTGVFQSMVEILFGGVFRLANLGYTKYFDYIIEEGKKRRESMKNE